MTDDLLAPPQDRNYLEDLVGDNKKFKSAEDLAKGKYIADNYILTLEAQLDQMRTDYLKIKEENQAKAGLQELIDRMNSQRQMTKDIQTPMVPEQKPPVFDPKQIDDLIESRMNERELARRQTENISQVKAKLEQHLGREYHEALQSRMDTLDISKDEFNNMARNNPKALIKLLDLEPQQYTPSRDPFAPPRSNIRTDQFKPAVEKKTWSYWQRLKDTDPKKYHSSQTNVEMHKAMMELGSEFEDGDYNRFDKDFRIKY
jgi:hypothetical protein